MKRFFSATCDVLACVWLWNLIADAAGALAGLVIGVFSGGD